MLFKKVVVHSSIAGMLALGAVGAGAPANADPDWEDWNHNEWVDEDWRDNWRDNNDRGDQWRNNNDWGDRDWKGWEDRQDWKRWNDHDWDKWWRVNKWRNDDRPPWGWGPPPAVHWRGHVPHWIDYWGFRVFPIWDPHLKVFGFWLFGIFIPVWVI